MSSIKIGEANKTIYLNMEFNVNEVPFTTISMLFTSPDGTIKFSRTSPVVEAPAVDSGPIPQCRGDDVILLANEYLTYPNQATDFTITGNWCVRAKYEDASGSIFIGDPGVVTITEECA